MGSYHVVHLWAILAVLATALFAGASLHVSLVEHPARLACPTPVALAQWRASVRQAARLQPFYALAGALFAVLTWWGDGGIAFLVAGILVGSVLPYRWLAVTPVVRQLRAETIDSASASTRALLVSYGRLHAVRTVLALAALLTMLVQSLWYWGL